MAAKTAFGRESIGIVDVSDGMDPMNRLASVVAMFLLLAGTAHAQLPGEADHDRPITPRARGPETRPVGTLRRDDSGGRGGSIASTVLTLTAVVALLGGSTWFARRQGWGVPRQDAGPLKLLARLPVDHRHSVLVLQCGSRLLVVGQAATGLSALCEISDPGEVEALSEQCATAGNDRLGSRLIETWWRRSPGREAA